MPMNSAVMISASVIKVIVVAEDAGLAGQPRELAVGVIEQAGEHEQGRADVDRSAGAREQPGAEQAEDERQGRDRVRRDPALPKRSDQQAREALVPGGLDLHQVGHLSGSSGQPDQAWMDLVPGPLQVVLEVDLDPGQTQAVHPTEPLAAGREDQIAHRLLVDHVGPAAVDIALDRACQARRAARAEAREADPLGREIVAGHLDPLVKLDHPVGLDADLEGLLADRGATVDQQAILVRRIEQARQQPPVIEHVGIHVEHRLAGGEHVAQSPEREQAAGPIVGIEPGLDAVGGAEQRELAPDLLGPMADHERDVEQAEMRQDVEMALEQALAGEAQQGLGRRLAVLVEPHPDARRQHGDLHAVCLPRSAGRPGPARSAARRAC